MADRTTTLVARLGSTTFPLKLSRTVSDPPDVKFEKAGPHGRPLVDYVIQEGRPGVPGLKAVVEKREDGFLEESLEGKELRRGVFLADGSFIDMTEHLQAIDEEEALEEMELLGFIRREALPLEAVQGSYWAAPGDPVSAKVLRLIHAASRSKHRMAVVAWTKTKNRAIGVLVPHASGAMLLTEVAFAANIREIPARALAPKFVDVTEEETAAAEALIEAMSESPDLLEEVEDERRARRVELMETALAEGTIPDLPTPAEITALPELDTLEALILAA